MSGCEMEEDGKRNRDRWYGKLCGDGYRYDEVAEMKYIMEKMLKSDLSDKPEWRLLSGKKICITGAADLTDKLNMLREKRTLWEKNVYIYGLN